MEPYKFNLSVLINEGSAGIINGLILCIYALTFGFLLVSHHGGNLLGVAIGSMLIGGMFGSLYGIFSKDKTLTCGPSGGAASIMTGSALVFFSGNDLSAGTLIFPIILLGLMVALVFYCIVQFGATNLFKFIPYSVFIGLMAASGYLMAKGAALIIFGGGLPEASLMGLFHELMKLEIFSGFLIALLFIVLAHRVPDKILIPGIILITSILINVFLKSDFCFENICDQNRWFFAISTNINWVPSWKMDYQGLTFIKLLEFLPIVLSISFICILSILVSFENLYIWFSEEYDSREELKRHSILIGVSALFGGFISTLAFQRVILNKKIGAGVLGSVIACLFAFVAFWQIDTIVKFIPSCVIGGFLLYQGVEIIQKSFSNRKNLAKIDIILACLILFLVATHSFVYGFIVGMLLSFLYSLFSLSRIPLIDKQGDLGDFRSSIIRPHAHELVIREQGKRVKYFRLEGYLFYGTVTQLDSILTGLNFDEIDNVVIDATKVSGMDTSAKISLGRIFARHNHIPFKCYLVANSVIIKALLGVVPKDAGTKNSIFFYDDLELALGDIEKNILDSSNTTISNDCFQFLCNENQKLKFISYCERIALSKEESFTCRFDGPQELYFILDGECTLETVEGSVARVLSRVFSGAFISEASFSSKEGAEVEIVAQKDSVILGLPLKSIQRMSIEDPDLHNFLNTYMIKVLNSYLLHARKLIR